MAFWNTGAMFNRKGEQGGFTWNSAKFLFIVRINDTLRVSDNVSETLARIALSEKPMEFYDTLVNTAFYGNIREEFTMVDEDPFVTLLFELAENIGIKDELTDFIVQMFLEDKVKVLDDIRLLVEILESEDFHFDEITDIKAFFEMLDRYGLEDLKAESLVEIIQGDTFGISDHDGKIADSDFLVGHSDDVDTAYDYLLPLEMKIDYKNSDFQIMPPVQSAEIEMPGVDGAIREDTVYKTRLFKLVCYSEDNLTISQKEDLKRRITEVLDSTKHQTKKLTIQSRGISFDVKYENSDAKDGPSFVKNTITFSSQPYGYDMFEQELYGGGLILNQGVTPLRPCFTITGYVSNPSFRLNEKTFRFNGVVPSGSTLTIDFERYTCFLKDNMGNKTNALAKLTGEFISIEPGKSMVLVPDNSTSSRIVTTWRNSVLW